MKHRPWIHLQGDVSETTPVDSSGGRDVSETTPVDSSAGRDVSETTPVDSLALDPV